MNMLLPARVLFEADGWSLELREHGLDVYGPDRERGSFNTPNPNSPMHALIVGLANERDALREALAYHETHSSRETPGEVQANAILEAVSDALEGRLPSDFMLSFPIVRLAADLYWMANRAAPARRGAE